MNNPLTILTDPSSPFIFLPTMINGRGPYKFVLDTGAGMTVLTDELAMKLGLTETGVRDAIGAPGIKLSVRLGVLDSLSVGDAGVNHLEVGFLAHLPKCTGDGALGYNFLKNYRVTIDYPRNLLSLSRPAVEPGQGADAEDVLELRLARHDRPLILVEAVVNGSGPYQFVLDTGASLTVISKELSRQISMPTKPSGNVSGAGGGSPASSGMIRTLAVGKVTGNDVAVCTADIFPALSEAIGTRIDGILGYNFLRHYTISLDYPEGAIRFWASGMVSNPR